MKNLILSALVATFFIFGFQPVALASHVEGADFFIQYLDGDTFQVTLNFYRSCASATQAPTSMEIYVSSASNSFEGTLTLYPVTTIQPQGIANGADVSPLCAADISSDECNGGNLPGVQEYQYTEGVILPFAADDWTFTLNGELAQPDPNTIETEELGRNAAINNFTNAGSDFLFIQATINNSTYANVSTPTFVNLPVPYFCYDDSVSYNHGTIDADGDSLVYALYIPYTATSATTITGTHMRYAGGYSFADPITGPFAFNTLNGEITLENTNPGGEYDVIAVSVKAYRNGVFVDSTVRDMEFHFLGSTVCSPPYNYPVTQGITPASVSGSSYVNDYEVQTCPGQNVSFSISMGGNNIVLSSDVSQAIPGASFNVDQISADSVIGTFNWIPSINDTGIKVFSLVYGLNSCPINGGTSNSQSVTIIVGRSVNAGPNQTYCVGGTPIQLYATGGSSFTWSPGAGLNDSVIQNPIATPTVTTSYIVTSNLAGTCQSRDTVVVTAVPKFSLNVAPSNNVNTCRGIPVDLSLKPDSIYAPFTYKWSPTTGLSNSTIANPIATPLNTTAYYVTVTSNGSCKVVDTVNVNVLEAAPSVAISTPRNMVCDGSTVPLTAVVTPVTCGAAVGSGSCGGSNPAVPISYGSGSNATAVTPFGGSYSATMYQALYRADSLKAAGITAGTIVRLQLNVANVSSTKPFPNFTIQMGCTGDNQLDLYNWEPVNTVVYSSTAYTPTVGTNTFSFSQPYDWDGVSNLVLQICYGGGTIPGDNDNVTSSNMLYPASMAAFSDSVYNGCNIPANQVSTSNLDYSVPNITLSFCTASTPIYTYLWSPSNGLTSTSADTTSAVSVTQPVTYSVTVSDTLCSASDTIRLTLDTSSLSLEPRDTSLCGSDTVQLSVSLNGTLPVECGANGNTCVGPAKYIQVDSSKTDNADFTYPAPFGNFYPSAMQQYLYTAADLIAAGVKPGRITQIAFYVQLVDNTATTEYDYYSLQAGCSSATSLSIGSPVTGLTTVYNPRTVNLTNTPGWVNFVLDTDIDWDGSSNLVIQNCFDNTNTTNPIGTFSNNANSPYVTTGHVVTSTIYASNTSQTCYNPTNLAYVSGDSSRPILRLNMCQPPLPYTVSWSPGQTLSDSTSNAPLALPRSTTTYYVTVVSPSGCTKRDSLTVNLGALAPAYAKDTAACVGSQLQLTAVGGNEYSWTPATGLSCTTCPNPIVTVDSNRQYIVTITDTLKGCSVNDTVNVVALSLPTIPYSNDTFFCFSDSTTIDAGAGDSFYVWSPTNPVPNDSLYEVKSPGTYSVTVTGFNGCTVTDTVTIHQYAQPLVNLGKDTSICAPGTLTLNAGGPYTSYLWSTGASTQTIVVDSTNNYSVTVTDANGCKSSDSILIGVNATPVINLGGPDTACYTDSVRLSANNGPTYTYLWSTGSTDSVIEVTNLNAGEIYVTVSGGTTCNAVDSANVFFRPPVAVFIGDDTTVCIGSSVTFGAADFAHYTWSTGNSGAFITVNTAGTYYVTVTDANGCNGYDSATLSITRDSLYLGPDTSVCVGTTLTLGNRLGNPFVSYSWSTGAITDTIHVTTTGPYSLTATPASGCPGVDTINVTFVPAPVITFPLPLTAGLCPGGTDTLSPGPQPSGSTYLWSDSTTDSILIISKVGLYWVQVTNSTGCTSRDSINIPIKPAPNVPFLQNVTVCKGDSTTIDASNTGLIAFLWSTGATTDSIRVTNPATYYVTVTNTSGCSALDSETVANTVVVLNLPSDTNLCPGKTITLYAGNNYVSYIWSVPNNTTDSLVVSIPGTYYITVTDIHGCSGDDSTIVGLNPAVTPVFNPDSVSVCPSVGYTLYPGKFRTYYWSTGITNSTLTVDTTGEYFVTVTDDNGCPGYDSAYVQVYPVISPVIQGDTLLCSLTADTLSSVATYSSYHWSNGDSTQTIVVTNPATYGLTVTDTNGCPDTSSFTVVNGRLSVTATVDTTPINPGTLDTLNVLISQADSAITYVYTWAPDTSKDSVSNPKIQNPTISPTVTTIYSVTVTNPLTGCTGTDTVTVEVDSVPLFAFPSAFTPNHDQHNDFFGLITSGNVVLEDFKIFDRWGALVHNTPVPWDGQFDNKDQPIGTYVYTATIQYTDSLGVHTIKYKGAFTLLR